MFDTIEKLTTAMAAGDEVAVESFYRRYFDWLYIQARRASQRDEAFSLDVVQESMLRIIRSIRAIPAEQQLTRWLKLVVRTTTYDMLRAERRRERRERAVVLMTAGAAESHDLDRADDEQINWLRQEIARLDPQLVRMIELRYEHRWTLQRIGKLLGLSAGTIDGRLRRTLKILRKSANSKGESDV